MIREGINNQYVKHILEEGEGGSKYFLNSAKAMSFFFIWKNSPLWIELKKN